MKGAGAVFLLGVALPAGSAAAARGYADEFPEAARNCELPQAALIEISDAADRMWLRLPADVYARREAQPEAGRIACLLHWGRERGLGLDLTPGPAPAPAPAPAAAADPAAREARLAEIRRECGMPETALRLNGGAVEFRPAPDARYESVNCVLRELRSSALLRDLPIGFVGNEARPRKAGNAQAH